jgi:DNA-binding CsgD family transcriptional regulator
MQHINTEQAKVLQELAVETLSDRELMYCMLFYLRMNVKDISGKMNVSPQSVWVIKNRIKKKFNLTKEQSLDQFLNDAFAEK